MANQLNLRRGVSALFISTVCVAFVIATAVFFMFTSQKPDYSTVKILTIGAAPDGPAAPAAPANPERYTFQFPGKFKAIRNTETQITFFYADAATGLPATQTTPLKNEIRAMLVFRPNRTMRSEVIKARLPEKTAQGGDTAIHETKTGAKNSRAISRTFVTTGFDGNMLLYVDPGTWSKALTVHRKFNDWIELEYVVPKRLVPNTVIDIKEIDTRLVKQVSSFEVKQ